jgi:hypothetical protein
MVRGKPNHVDHRLSPSNCVVAELRGKGFVARLLQSTGTFHAAQQTVPVGPLEQPSRRSLAGRRCLAA